MLPDISITATAPLPPMFCHSEASPSASRQPNSDLSRNHRGECRMNRKLIFWKIKWNRKVLTSSRYRISICYQKWSRISGRNKSGSWSSTSPTERDAWPKVRLWRQAAYRGTIYTEAKFCIEVVWWGWGSVCAYPLGLRNPILRGYGFECAYPPGQRHIIYWCGGGDQNLPIH